MKLYDCRSNETILTVNHGSPVESTLFLPSGGLFISGGGTEVKVWDIFNGGKLLANISQHHKTVTTLLLASNNSRLLSASLDRHVKVYDISTFKVVHSIDFPNAVLSIAVSEHDDVLAAGMIDGVISIRKREKANRRSGEKKGLFKFAPDHVQTKDVNATIDMFVNDPKSKTEPESDKFLKKMQFGKALQSVLKTLTATKYPEKTVAVIQELLRRKVLHVAMFGLDEKRIGALLRFFVRNLGETRFIRTIIDAANVFIDVYENQVQAFSESNLWLYKSLQKELKDEIEVCKRVSELEGAISLLLAGAQINNNLPTEIDTFAPSAKALKEIVIDVE